MSDLGSYLPRGMYRNRRLLDQAHDLDRCTNCGAFSVDGLEPAHSNLQEHGRGASNKSHDLFYAALCRACHFWLDHGKGMDPSQRFEGTREGKRDMFIRAMHATWLALWQFGKVKVS